MNISKIDKHLKRALVLIVIIVQTVSAPIASYAIESESPSSTVTTDEVKKDETTPEVKPAEPKTEQTVTAPAPTAPTAPTAPVAPSAPKPDETQTTKPPKTTGPKKPGGPNSKSYVYNKQTGLWENNEYTWDPITKETKSKKPEKYTFNKESGMWETTKWMFDAPSGKYIPNVIKSSEEPLGHKIDALTQSSSDADINITNDSTVNNKLRSCSISGDASVAMNTHGGDASSGNAYTMANVLNMLNSNWGNLGSDVKTFTTDVNGDVSGDLYINPGAISNSTSKSSNNLDVNASNNASIGNNIKLCSKTGNALVDSNTTGGSAKSGNADAVANLMNLINSTINAGDSFVGVMNINGNLNGDILLPDYLGINDLLYANGGPNSKLGNYEVENSQMIADMLSSTNIENNIETTAESGQAAVKNNNTAGNASSGSAQTNVTLMNLTGRDIVGNNGLLVFVNVLGTWVGFIVDAPQGSTSAALGGGVSSNTQHDSTKDNNANINLSDQKSIENNVEVMSESGDADVTNNTVAGDASTGNASASANILNLVDSQLSLKDWFGILFINVFGSWNGSFGVDTPSGNNLAALEQLANTGEVPVQQTQVFSFVPSSGNKVKLNNLTNQFKSSSDGQPQFTLASAQINNPASIKGARTNQALLSATKKNNLMNALNFGAILTLSFLGIEQVSGLINKAKLNKATRLSQTSSNK